ncbi:ribose-phosphate pyrophosphokinase [Erythrobacter sp. SCSIO 43205]|uniref:ribose-phosphate pyrophosphokinase n=1 Tax=Erythrobacter sp. SCSIO 43205 TaxID=2779361 RepID=UPI001CA84E4B|nr:ribose-phosphate pyrophosphokinase [Erythrobacter sp. SCSIO 43205]UAB78337.1 ribose-phosphate pyrophosphokinase [Erythrobacter sp. SCSIO 43205]
MFDPGEVREILKGAARAGNALTYSQMLGLLGYGFTRPKMRALCKVLDAHDEDARIAGEPGLAVLVVRQSDGLPGQGWFVSRSHLSDEMQGEWPLDWEGVEAKNYVALHQKIAFDYWRAP